MRKTKNAVGLNFSINYTKLQKEVLNFFRSNEISILTGDPGTGKSFISIYYALQLLKDNAVEKIVISKPLVEVGSSMGFLPGSEQEKTDVYLESYKSTFIKIIGYGAFTALLNAKKIEFKPVNFIRGTNLEYSAIIMDEVQGLTLHELITFVTRLSSTSKMILCGDVYQKDIKNSGIVPFLNIVKGIDGIGVKELGPEFQMRNPMLVKIYENYKHYLNTK
jgi:phosphate starvation-inducible PhoH-like protein